MMNSDQPTTDLDHNRDRPPDQISGRTGCMFGAYFLVALLGMSITKLASASLLGSGSTIADPVLREQMGRLQTISLVIWVLGGIGLALGSWLRANEFSSQPKVRRLIALGMLLVPVLCLLFSVWVAYETTSASDRSNPMRRSVGHWFVSSPSGSGSGTLIYLRDGGVEPGSLTIPANVPIRLIVVNTGSIPHSLAFTGFDRYVPLVSPSKGIGIDVTINAPPGDLDFRCPIPGHESESGGTLHVVQTEVVAEIIYDGSKLSSEDLHIPAEQFITIRIHNASPDLGDDVLIEFAGLTGPPGTADVRFWVPRGQTTDLVMTVPEGEWLFWGTSQDQWARHRDDGNSEGDVPGGTLIAEPEVVSS